MTTWLGVLAASRWAGDETLTGDETLRPDRGDRAPPANVGVCGCCGESATTIGLGLRSLARGCAAATRRGDRTETQLSRLRRTGEENDDASEGGPAL